MSASCRELILLPIITGERDEISRCFLLIATISFSGLRHVGYAAAAIFDCGRGWPAISSTLRRFCAPPDADAAAAGFREG